MSEARHTMTSLVSKHDLSETNCISFLQVAADNEAEFYINLQGAGDGELTVYGEAPYGEFPVDLLQSPTEKDTYIVRYTPRGVGEHKIHILFAGEPVAGSPFIVNVWKARVALLLWFS